MVVRGLRKGGTSPSTAHPQRVGGRGNLIGDLGCAAGLQGRRIGYMESIKTGDLGTERRIHQSNHQQL